MEVYTQLEPSSKPLGARLEDVAMLCRAVYRPLGIRFAQPGRANNRSVCVAALKAGCLGLQALVYYKLIDR
jgi:hypothetical protein